MWDSTRPAPPWPVSRRWLAAAALLHWRLLGGAGHLVHGPRVRLRTTLLVANPRVASPPSPSPSPLSPAAVVCGGVAAAVLLGGVGLLVGGGVGAEEDESLVGTLQHVH